MADPLIRRAKKWTYLTWCDLRNHPFMLIGCLVGALLFAFVYLQTDDTKTRVQGVERTVKIPRRCTVAHIPHAPSNVVILFCNPATKREIAAAEKKKAAARATKTLRHKGARAKSGTNRHLPHAAPGSPNGNSGIRPPSSAPPPSRSPPARSPSGGGSQTPPPPPPQRAAPGLTTPPLGPIPSLTVPLPSLPPLPLGQLTGR